MTQAQRTPDVNQAAADSGPLSSSVPGSAGGGSGTESVASGSGSISVPSASITGSASMPPESAAGVSPASRNLTRSGHEKFHANELAIVLSHFDLGIIEKIKEFPRGSRKAPKLVLRSEKGTFLLKRRARGKDDAFKVAFCHQLQMYLASKQFPLPHLIGTKNENNSMLQWNDTIYELFEFIKGTGFESSLEQTSDSGRIQAIFHKLLLDFKSEYQPPTGSYHASRHVTASLDRIPATLSKLFADAVEQMDAIKQVLQFLHAAYASAMVRVNDAGLLDWPAQIVHSDWHPGNMLFRGPRVVAVIDYDAARIQQRIIDVANGALQFSILGGGDDPMAWPEHLDEARFLKFLRSYDDVPGCQLTRAELRVVPHLMIEALVAEAAIPIANTGQFARMPGHVFLTMVERKVRWMQKHAERLANILES
ncbi:MAG: phosphotransferase [Phycisphaeraceae bacterium]